MGVSSCTLPPVPPPGPARNGSPIPGGGSHQVTEQDTVAIEGRGRGGGGGGMRRAATLQPIFPAKHEACCCASGADTNIWYCPHCIQTFCIGNKSGDIRCQSPHQSHPYEAPFGPSQKKRAEVLVERRVHRVVSEGAPLGKQERLHLLRPTNETFLTGCSKIGAEFYLVPD